MYCAKSDRQERGAVLRLSGAYPSVGLRLACHMAADRASPCKAAATNICDLSIRRNTSCSGYRFHLAVLSNIRPSSLGIPSEAGLMDLQGRTQFNRQRMLSCFTFVAAITNAALFCLVCLFVPGAVLAGGEGGSPTERATCAKGEQIPPEPC